METTKPAKLGYLQVGDSRRAHTHSLTEIEASFGLSSSDGSQSGGWLQFVTDRADRTVTVTLRPDGMEVLLDTTIGRLPTGYTWKSPRLKRLCQMILAGFAVDEEQGR